MPITTAELEYPVIALCGRGIIEVREDEDILTTATSRELGTHWFDTMTIVDCNGTAVDVKGARFVSGKGRFWGYTLYFSRIIKVDLRLDDKVSIMSVSYTHLTLPTTPYV